MKIKVNSAPNYPESSSTRKVMLELTIALLVVFGFALYYQFTKHGMANVMHVCVLMLSAIVTAVVCEMLWAVVFVKKNPITYIKDSFPWVTAIILVLMLPANTGIYPLIVGTFFAIVVAKLAFGGFGQNIFNPAAVGCAIIFSYFATGVVTDVQTLATPTSTIASTYGWLINDSTLISKFLGDFGGLQGLFLGMHDGGLGETCSLLIIGIGIYLSVRKIIDWRVPVFYVGTVFVLALIVGMIHGTGFWYPVFHILTGGLMFGAVFMATDPVTNPTSNAGKIIFAIGCGLITFVIRIKANLPEGVLYSILLMNMLTPWIENAVSGVQYKITKKVIGIVGGLSAVSVCLAVVLAGIIAPVVPVPPTPPVVKEFLNKDKHITLSDDLSVYVAKVTKTTKDGNNTVYTVEVDGYAVVLSNYVDPKPNIILVTINTKTKTIVSVAYEKFTDTEYVGDSTKDNRFLSQFIDMDINNSEAGVDAVTGATVTSECVVSAVQAAIKKVK